MVQICRKREPSSPSATENYMSPILPLISLMNSSFVLKRPNCFDQLLHRLSMMHGRQRSTQHGDRVRAFLA